MNNLFRHKKLIFIIATFVVIISISLFIYRYFSTLYVSSTTPSQSQSVSYLTPTITLKFNKDIDAGSVDISLPDSLVANYSVEGSILNINVFSGLMGNKEYVFKLNSISSVNGLSLKNYTYTLKTNTSTSLSEAEQALTLQRQERNKPNIMNDPVVANTPYSSDEYYIDTHLDGTPDGKGRVTIEITLFLTRDQSRNTRDASIAEIKQSANNYLHSIKDVDMANYDVFYVIQEP